MPTVILWGLLCVSGCIGLWLASMGAHGVWKVFRMRKCLPWRTAIVRQVEGEDMALLRLEGETEKVRCQLPHAIACCRGACRLRGQSMMVRC